MWALRTSGDSDGGILSVFVRSDGSYDLEAMAKHYGASALYKALERATAKDGELGGLEHRRRYQQALERFADELEALGFESASHDVLKFALRVVKD